VVTFNAGLSGLAPGKLAQCLARQPQRRSICGHRFPPEVIAHAAWLYFRFHLSFRDVQDLLAERGVIVSHEAIRQ